MSKRPLLWIIAAIWLAASLISMPTAHSQEPGPSWTGHVVYGQMTIDNDDAQVDGDDYDFTIFGVDAQKSFRQGWIQYGVEIGALFSIDSSLRQFSASSGSGGGTAGISVDISSFLMDYYFGGYVSIEPVRWLRLYAGAGPLLIWGFRDAEPAEPLPEPHTEESESGVGVGGYGRVGIDILFTDWFGIGAGARVTKTTLSFDETAGEIDIEGVQYYGGLSFHF
jgi:hypothetical protein